MAMLVNSVYEVVEELDGAQAVADLFGIERGVVDMWVFREAFPPNTYLVLQNALAEHNCVAPGWLWKMREAAE